MRPMPLPLRITIFFFIATCLTPFAATCSYGQATQLSVAELADKPKDYFSVPDSDAGLPGTGPIRRYDWFQNLWQEKRSRWSRQAESDQNALVFLGDSITQGWGDNLGGSFDRTKVANRGISGDTTRGMLVRLYEDVLILNPMGVVILAGTNDLEENADPTTIAANMKLLVQSLHKKNPTLPIVLCLVFPSSETKSRPAEKIQKINDLYQAAVQGMPSVTVVDCYSLFADKNGDATSDLFPDLLHPNRLGYQKWAAALRPHLQSTGLVAVETDAGTSPPAENSISLFNGKNLNGWTYQPSSQQDRKAYAGWKANDPNAPAWPILDDVISHDQKTVTDDGRYQAINGRFVVMHPPEGRKIQQIWTQETFSGNFDLQLQFRAMPNADSGVFILGKQLQCRDFLRAGPYKELTQFRDLDWNDLLIQVRNGKARCTCNGEVLEEAFEVPGRGRIGIEGDRGQIEYRHMWLTPKS